MEHRLKVGVEMEREDGSVFHKVKLCTAALLGYGYVVFILILFVACLAGISVVYVRVSGHEVTALQFAIVVTLSSFFIGRVLNVRNAELEGLVVTKAEVPVLFEHLEHVRQQLKALPIDQVILTENYDATVTQYAQFGILGPRQVVLELGLPLLMTLSEQEFRALLAHEMTCISLQHARLQWWALYMRAVWVQVAEEMMKKRGLLVSFFRPFFVRYALWYGEFMRPYAAKQEWLADQRSAEVTSPEVVASLFLHARMRGHRFSQTFMPRIYEQIKTQTSPPAHFFDLWADDVRTPIEREEYERFLHQELNAVRGAVDDSPTFQQRLDALGVSHFPYVPDKEVYIHELLAPSYIDIMEEMNAVWKMMRKESWNERYHFVVEMVQKASEVAYVMRHSPEKVTDEQRWEYACYVEQTENAERAFPLYEAYLHSHPQFLPANFAVGRILLQRGDYTGIALLEKTMEEQEDGKLDFDYVLEGSHAILQFYHARGEKHQVEQMLQRLESYQRQYEQAIAERERLDETMTLVEHDCSSGRIAEMSDQLRNYPFVEAAYFVQKQLELTREPIYVLGVVFKRSLLPFLNVYPSYLEQLADELSLPDETVIACLNNDHLFFIRSELHERVQLVPNSLIYEKA